MTTTYDTTYGTDRFGEDYKKNTLLNGDNGRLERAVGHPSPIVSPKFDYRVAELIMNLYQSRVDAYRKAYEHRHRFFKLFSRRQRLEQRFHCKAMNDIQALIRNITIISDLNIFCYGTTSDFRNGAGYYRLN